MNDTKQAFTMPFGESITKNSSELSIEKNITGMVAFPVRLFGGVFVGNEQFHELNAKLDELSKKYGASPSALAIAWILRRPAGIQAIVGKTNTSRLADICHAADVELTREDWYALYLAAGNRLSKTIIGLICTRY